MSHGCVSVHRPRSYDCIQTHEHVQYSKNPYACSRTHRPYYCMICETNYTPRHCHDVSIVYTVQYPVCRTPKQQSTSLEYILYCTRSHLERKVHILNLPSMFDIITGERHCPMLCNGVARQVCDLARAGGRKGYSTVSYCTQASVHTYCVYMYTRVHVFNVHALYSTVGKHRSGDAALPPRLVYFTR